MNIEIANRLVELRKRKGLSQEELADKLGISRQAVSKWERAEAGPDVDNAIRLSRLYGVTLDELFGNKPDYERAIEAMRLREEAGEGAEPADEPGEEPAFSEAEAVPAHAPQEGEERFDGVQQLIIERLRANVRIGRSEDGAAHIEITGPEEERRLVRVSLSDKGALKLSSEPKRRLFFGFSTPHRLRVRVAIPRGVKLISAEMGGGDLELSGISVGNTEVRTGGGDIRVSQFGADTLDLTCGGGDITLTGVKAGRVSVKTGGGDIEAARIEVGAALSLSTGGGDIKAEGTAGSLVLRTGGGDVKVNMEAASADAKSGGGELELKLVHAKDVTARTGGGEIEVKLIGAEGADLDLASMGGRSRVIWQGEQLASGRSITLRAGDGSTRVDAKSGGGDITVAAE